MTLTKITAERILYDQAFWESDSDKREACLQALNTHLHMGSALCGIANPEHALLLQKCSLEVLRDIAAIGTGEWRHDLEAYIARSGLRVLDNLFLLRSKEADNLWAEMIPSLIARGWDEMALNQAVPLRDAINETLAGMLHSGRFAVLVAIMMTQPDDLKMPVCLAYCRTALRKRMSNS